MGMPPSTSPPLPSTAHYVNLMPPTPFLPLLLPSPLIIILLYNHASVGRLKEKETAFVLPPTKQLRLVSLFQFQF